MTKGLWIAAVAVCLLATGCVLEACPFVWAIFNAVGG